MQNSNESPQSVQRELDALGAVRDELRVRLHLAKAEARDEWNKLERTFELVGNKAKLVGAHSKDTAKEVGKTARELIEELKNGYRNIRSQIEESSRRNA